METKHLVYKNNIDAGGITCSSNSDLLRFLDLRIQKFNHRYNKNIGLYGEETLEGDVLRKAISILTDELVDLVDNYHQDADSNGSGRSAMKVEILGKQLVLDHFRCKIDQIIYSLNRLIYFLRRTSMGNGKVEFYGLGDIDILDCNIILEAKKILKAADICHLQNLKNSVKYLFYVDDIIKREPNVVAKRVEKLEKKGYLKTKENKIELSNKGKVVGVYSNFIVKTITIDKEKLKISANNE